MPTKKHHFRSRSLYLGNYIDFQPHIQLWTHNDYEMIQMALKWSNNRFQTKGGGTHLTTDLNSPENSDLPSTLQRIPPPAIQLTPN